MYHCVLVLAVVSAIHPLLVKGTGIYDSVTKQRFYMKGVAYSPDLYANPTAHGDATPSVPGEDHISDDRRATWEKDIPNLVELGVNVVRIYQVDPAKSHDLFMNALAAKGIYAIIPATSSVGPGVLDNGKAAPLCYTAGLLRSAKSIVNAFAKYNNTLAFVTGNEVGNPVLVGGKVRNGYQAIPCVKALTRDLRAYMRKCSCGMRYVPLMYAATDFPAVKAADGSLVKPRDLISQFLSCGRPEDQVDIYGVNIYTWCALDATYDRSSTYKIVTEAYKTYQMPMVFSEYGCNVGNFESHYDFSTGQRQWKQVDTLFAAPMIDVWAGGIAYQYSMTENDFGMVLLPGYKANQPNIVKLANYHSLAMRHGNITPPATFGDWGGGDRCTWKGPSWPTRRPNTCPSSSAVTTLFKTGGIPETDNWSGALPSLNPDPTMDDILCEKSELGEVDVAENACRGECNCTRIVPNPFCHVDWDKHTEADTIKKLFDRQCGNLAQYGKEYSRACELLTGAGDFAGCSLSEKANYILDIWASYVEQTCCVTDPCEAIPPFQISTQPVSATVPWRERASFTLVAAGGSLPYRYQWQKAGVDVAHGTGATLEWREVDTLSAGEYWCNVMDAKGTSVHSNPATLTVLPPEKKLLSFLMSSKYPNPFGNANTTAHFLATMAGEVEELAIRPTDLQFDSSNERSPAGGPYPYPLEVSLFLLLGGPSKGKSGNVDLVLKQKIADGTLNHKLEYLNLRAESLIYKCASLVPGPQATAKCNGTEEGATCVCSCVPGYTLGGGNVSRVCLHGQWEGTNLLCVPVPPRNSKSFPAWAVVLIVVGVLALVVTVLKMCHSRRTKSLEYLPLQG